MQFTQILEHYNQYLKNNPFAGSPANLYEPINYILDLGGKRVRPVLALNSAMAAGGQIGQAMQAAHAIEVFHNFTLLHDDIMDQAPSRRGKPTAHLLYGIPSAILSGDNMLILAVQLIQTQPNHSIQLFLQTAQQVCEGQQMDINFENQSKISMTQYLKMIELKTAVLLGAACYIGAASVGLNQQQCLPYYQFGLQLGMAFQMQDDWLDTFGSSQQTGKIEGGDIIARKKMWLYIKAKELNSNIDELYDIEDSAERVKKCLALFKQLQLDQMLIQSQETYYQQAQRTLQTLQLNSQSVEAFQQILAFLEQRKS